MADIRAAVLAFHPRSGAGAQTVTGVSDADGDFVGKVFLWVCPYVPSLDTVTSSTAGTGAYSDQRGVDTGAIRSAVSTESLFSPFNAKAVTLGVSNGQYSIIDYWTTNLGSYAFDRGAYITAIRAGEFDLQFDTNYATGAGERILAIVLGGDDLDVTFTDVNPGTYTTVAKPQGLLGYPVPIPSSSGSTAGSVGGVDMVRGFATRDGAYGAAALNVVLQGDNFTVQRTSAWSAAISDGGVLGALPTVSAWGDTSVTYANGAGSVAPLVICGDLVATAGGQFTQAATTGDQVIDLGLRAKLIWFFSIGQAAATTVHATPGQYAEGWGTALAQVSYWGGENTNGNVGPQTGARLMSASTVLRFGVPAAGSTTFTAVASLVDVGTDETATINWSVNDGVGRQILWFAIGEGEAPPPPPPEPVYRTREVVRRRLRRAPIVWSEKGGLQTRVKINLFAVDMQPGVGTSDTPDPLVMIRASKDGGFTWGNERRLTAGRVGEFFNRINAWQWGQGRDWVFEVSCTDPVLWNLVGAYFDAEGGEN